MKFFGLILLLPLLLHSKELSQRESELLEDVNFLIDQIKNNNPTSQRRITFRSGLTQVVGGTPGLELNGSDSMPLLGLELVWSIYKNFAIEARTTYAQNILYSPSNELNGSDINQQSYDFGLRYIWELDPTRRANYFAFKAMIHQTDNNFALVDPSTTFLINSYSALLGGIEKGFPITNEICLESSLDFMLLTNAEGPSELAADTNGVALQVRGEIYHVVDWFGVRARVGAAYWQAAFSNEFNEDTKVELGRQNHFQTFRMVTMSYGLLF